MPLTKIQTELLPDQALEGGNKNIIINPFMDITQRGTTFTSVVSDAYTLDRFQYIKSGVMVHDINQVADAPTTVQAGTKIVNCMSVDVTTPDTVISAGDYAAIAYKIEGYDFRKISGQTFTLSFWVKATTTGTYSISLKNSGSNRSYASEYTIDTTNTWEKKSITVLHDETGTWDYENGMGMRVVFALACGATYRTSNTDVWESGFYLAAANQVNGTDTGSTNFRITGIQVELGDVVSQLEYRKYSEELSMCQRYYQSSDSAYGANTLFSGDVSNGAGYYASMYFMSVMRSVPSVSLTSVINTGFSTSTSVEQIDTIGFREYRPASATLTGLFTSEWTADAEL